MPSSPPSFTRFIPPVVRYLMGVPLLIFGLNCFLNFIPQSPVMPAGAAAFTSALQQTGYMMALIGATQVLVGALLVTNRFVPLALLLFAPFIVNSLCFHAVLAPSGLVMALVFLAFELYLAWVHRAAFRPVLTARYSGP